MQACIWVFQICDCDCNTAFRFCRSAFAETTQFFAFANLARRLQACIWLSQICIGERQLAFRFCRLVLMVARPDFTFADSVRDCTSAFCVFGLAAALAGQIQLMPICNRAMPPSLAGIQKNIFGWMSGFGSPLLPVEHHFRFIGNRR